MSHVRGRSSVSSSIHVRYGRGPGRRAQMTSQHVRDAAAKRLAAVKKYKERVVGLDYVGREELGEMDVDPEGWEDDPTFFPIPPGDEGVLASHAGGEVELCKDLLEDKRHRYDHRTRHDRTHVRNMEWATQLPGLVDAYLAWQLRCSSASTTDAPPQDANPSEEQARTWYATVIEYFAMSTIPLTATSPSELPTATLAKRGFLAVTPLQPTLAISFKVLESFRQLHGFCPRLSIQAFCQALCGIHQVMFRRHFAEQFSGAFDVYLDILHEIDNRAASALGRNQPNWRMLNACAPCLYRLEGEEELLYSFMASIDGNSSLKHVDDGFRSGQSRQDTRTWRTDISMPVEEVDQFQDEVSTAQKRATPSSAPAVPGSSQVPHAPAPPSAGAPSQPGLPIEVDTATTDVVVEEPCESKTVCAERWRNAGPESRKKMFALFAATGIFVCVCRHGHVLIMCDMVRSGELMKYALAVANRLMEVFGPSIRIKLGYDIGCEFSKTLDRSSLGERAKGVISCVVPAFHGHSHNRGCQLNWHPLYTEGVGLEDFETCERLFSFSNGAAAGTRMSTAFHRHQAIEGVIRFWGAQKHAASGKFIFNNYWQALQVIADGERVLDVYARDLGLTPEDYERYLCEERAYLQGLKSEPDDVSLKCEYIEALRELEQQRLKDAEAIATYKKLDYLIINDGIVGKQIRAIEREYRYAQTRVQRAEEKVHRLEEQLDIDMRWLPSSPEYKAASAEMGIRRYRRALDTLERLVIQRLFELKKLGMNGVGYKLREKIGQALKTRAQAIRTALASYNREAATLNPPRPELSWTEIMDMVSVGEFDLLRDSRRDIRELPWAKAPNRDGMNTYFKVKRAREEIARLNVEIRRLFSALIDQHVDYHRAVEQTKVSDPALSQELEQRHRYCNALAGHVVGWLLKTSKLPGFSGRVAYGHRVGRDKGLLDGVALPEWASYVSKPPSGEGDPDVDEEDDADDLEDGKGIPGAGGAGASGRFVAFVDGLDGSDNGVEDL